MIKVGIELNNVIRNVNKQILKYYKKDIDQSIDLDDIDDSDDVFKYAKFETLTDRNEFIYIDYPFEIFASAKPISKDLPMLINNWLSELTNYEDDDVEISFFSLNEEALTIQSSYFFLSKIGTRVRRVIFPKSVEEIKGEYDVIIANNKGVLDYFHNDDSVYTIFIKDSHTKLDNEPDDEYESLEKVIKDENFLSKIQEFVNNVKKINGNG